MVKGIYKITNNRTGEVYIGQSKDIESRKNTHFKELSQREHHNNGMQNDYSSGDTFSFEILEEMPNATKADLYIQFRPVDISVILPPVSFLVFV